MKLKLVDFKDEARGTKSFFWEPETPITWKPGQYLYYTIANLKYPDPRGTTRHFTISSSPTEGSRLRLTTRVREESGYKKTLAEIPIGGEVDGEGPNGTFVLEDDNVGPNVFIAGGIGITPYRAMIKYATDKKLSTKMHLIYSNSIPEEIAFREELITLTQANPNFKLSLTVSKPEESQEKWTGLTGRVDEAMIAKLVPDITNATFWVSGPPTMVDAMEALFGKMKITVDHLKTEKFTGY